MPRQLALIEINAKAVLFDLYQEYIERIVFHRGLGLNIGAGDVGGADSFEASQWTWRSSSWS